MTQLVYVCGVLLLLSMLHICLHAQISFGHGNITYWSSDSTVKLPWTYSFNSGDILAMVINFKRHGSTTSVHLAEGAFGKNLTSVKPGYTIEDQATLVFNNADLIRNGTYSFVIFLRASAGGGQKQFDVVVIILEQPRAKLNCSRVIVVDEGQDVVCVCSGSNGNPPPTASWSKDGSSDVIGGTGYLNKTLFLKNISKDDYGVYKCKVQSHDLIDEVFIQVFMPFKPRIQSIRNYPDYNVAVLGNALIVVCEAEGQPEPNYIISHNGTDIRNDKVFTLHPVKYKHAGVYECFAKNKVGNDSKRLTLLVTEAAVKTTPAVPDTRVSFSSSSPEGKSNAGIEWYIVFVALICGAIFGVVVMYLVMLYLRHRRNVKRCCKYCKPSGIQKTSNEQTENAPTYEELDLRKMNEGDSYQPLTKASKTGPNKTTNYENVEAGYEELNKVRGNDDGNYQNLRRT